MFCEDIRIKPFLHISLLIKAIKKMNLVISHISDWVQYSMKDRQVEGQYGDFNIGEFSIGLII